MILQLLYPSKTRAGDTQETVTTKRVEGTGLESSGNGLPVSQEAHGNGAGKRVLWPRAAHDAQTLRVRDSKDSEGSKHLCLLQEQNTQIITRCWKWGAGQTGTVVHTAPWLGNSPQAPPGPPYASSGGGGEAVHDFPHFPPLAVRAGRQHGLLSRIWSLLGPVPWLPRTRHGRQ